MVQVGEKVASRNECKNWTWCIVLYPDNGVISILCPILANSLLEDSTIPCLTFNWTNWHSIWKHFPIKGASCLVGHGWKENSSRWKEKWSERQRQDGKMRKRPTAEVILHAIYVCVRSRLADKCLFPDVRGLWFLLANWNCLSHYSSLNGME